MSNRLSDIINPKHYTQFEYQAIDLIHDMKLRDAYYFGSVLKYISRNRLKNGKEDLQKAMYFLKRRFTTPECNKAYINKFVTQLPNQEREIMIATFDNRLDDAIMLLNDFIQNYEKMVNPSYLKN